jgi:hypothetical protein
MGIGGCFLLGRWGFENKPWQPLTSPAEVENASSFPFPHMPSGCERKSTAKFLQSMSDNLETLIIQRLRRAVPRAEVLFLPEKSFISERDCRDMFKKVGVHLYIKHCGYPSSPTSASSVMNSPQNTEENPDDPAPTNEGDIQMKDSSA